MSLRRVLYIAGVVCLTAAPAGAQINFPDFTDSSGLTLNGAAATADNGVDPLPSFGWNAFEACFFQLGGPRVWRTRRAVGDER